MSTKLRASAVCCVAIFLFDQQLFRQLFFCEYWSFVNTALDRCTFRLFIKHFHGICKRNLNTTRCLYISILLQSKQIFWLWRYDCRFIFLWFCTKKCVGVSQGSVLGPPCFFFVYATCLVREWPKPCSSGFPPLNIEYVLR